MCKKLFLILFIGLNTGLATAALPNDCHSLVKLFIAKSAKLENTQLLKNNWSAKEKKLFIDSVRAMGFSDQNIKAMIDSLNMQKDPSTLNTVKNYLNYVFSLSEKDQKTALLDLAQLNAQEINSKHVKKFMVHEKNLQDKFAAKNMDSFSEKRFQDLYYGCRALRPNEVNKNAAKNFKSFNLSLSLGTLGASYAFYNMDKDLNGEWFAKLGYDVGVTILMSYVGGNIQTKATDTQIVKSLKGYFMGRALSVVDIAIYDPVFSKERENAEHRLEKLKSDPEYKKKSAELFKLYKEQGLYRKYKTKLISTLKNLPEGISLGLNGHSVDENNIDWNNLSHADLDRPEVQDVLVAASMAQVYQESTGEWIETGDTGLDRYAFNTIFYGLQIPKSIVQNFITYRMLCMGQDNVKLSFTKAVIFNVATNFMVNQLLYGYREKAINQ
jgi:hypothetical protein